MSDFISVQEVLNDNAYTVQRNIREEVLEMDVAVKRHMDAGLTPEDMPAAQKIRSAVHAADSILNKILA